MNKAWKPFEVVCTDIANPFHVHSELALAIDLILFDIIEGY